jgi:CheY-like chemotaxis protein
MAHFPHCPFAVGLRTVATIMSRVLVVDDNSDICLALITLIRLMGAEAECALGGGAALDYLAKRAVDLVILDYMMPDIDGLGVLRRMRAEPRMRDLPVLFFTAAAADTLRAQATALGAKAVIEKGKVSFNMLQRWIEPLINHPAPNHG